VVSVRPTLYRPVFAESIASVDVIARLGWPEC